MTTANPHINIFIAYSRKDIAYLNELRVYLKPLTRDASIHIWYDGEIIPGTPWDQAIKDQLKKADIILLLISCLLYTSPSPRDLSTSRMPSSA